MAARVNKVILVGNLGKDPMQEPKGNRRNWLRRGPGLNN